MTRRTVRKITRGLPVLLTSALSVLSVWYFLSYSFVGVVTGAGNERLRCLVAYDDYYELTESMKQRAEQPVILLLTDRADHFNEGDTVFAFTNSSCLDSSPRQTGAVLLLRLP